MSGTRSDTYNGFLHDVLQRKTEAQLIAVNFQLIVEICYTGSLLRKYGDPSFLRFAVDWPAQSHAPILSNDLHVVGIRRKRFICDYGAPNGRCYFKVSSVFFLVDRRYRRALLIANIRFGVFRLRSL